MPRASLRGPCHTSGGSPPFKEGDLLPLSALQHLMFCERQAALIHVEQQWAENTLTVEGSHMHRRVDETAPRRELIGGALVARGLPLRSLALGLSGRADVVEFRPVDEGGAALAGVDGQWRPFPVDYKRGRPKNNDSDEVQLCAQALCLEEMLATEVPSGALFYGRNRRRRDVAFSSQLRATTRAAAARLHEIVGEGLTPRAVAEAKCRRCSLLELCLPKGMTRRSASGYLRRAIRSVDEEEPP